MGGKAGKHPIRMLERSHQRLLGEVLRLQTLGRAVREGKPEDTGELLDVVAFFLRQGNRHEADEEKSLFPRLRGHVPSHLLTALRRQHRTHERLAERLDALLAGPLTEEGRREVQGLCVELAASYRAHIAREEAELLPAARQALGPEELALLADEMQARRGR